MVSKNKMTKEFNCKDYPIRDLKKSLTKGEQKLEILKRTGQWHSLSPIQKKNIINGLMKK